MKRYKVSIGDDEYRKDTESELPLCIRECIEKLIDSGTYSGTIDIPGLRYEFSVCPEQYFPEDMIDTIHRITAELRTMAETIESMDNTYPTFRQTVAVLRSSASRLTAAAIREHKRNAELIDENSNLCHFHQTHDKTYNPQYLNPDCPVCEREIDRRNNLRNDD